MNNHQPLLSVVIPVYNVEKYLQECIDSVLGQTYTDYEIILVDDGSTDSSGRICDDYLTADTRIQVIHQENGGLSAARNTGYEVAYALFTRAPGKSNRARPVSAPSKQVSAEVPQAHKHPNPATGVLVIIFCGFFRYKRPGCPNL